MRALAIVHQRDAGPGVFGHAMREHDIELEHWFRAEDDEPPRDLGEYGAVFSFGGAMHVDQEPLHPWLAKERAVLRELLDRDVPVLGVCLGAQLLAEAAGGAARRASTPEIGWLEVEVTAEGASDPLLAPLAPRFEAFEWHAYEFDLPPGATALARTPVCLQAYRIGDLAWGIQFHAEVSAADTESWIDDYRKDLDALSVGLDAESLRLETRAKLITWNELGRGICDRFLAAAQTRVA